MELKPSPDAVMCASVAVDDVTAAVQARRVATRLAQDLGFSQNDVGRVALVVTEAATNIARHAGHGEILIRHTAMDPASGIEILALDRGPGMANVARCMGDGFSTAGSLGVGLGAISRLSTTFDVFSMPDHGTALLSRISVPARPPVGSHLVWGAVCVPLRGEEVAGDAWAVVEARGRTSIMVVDGVGHGLHALDAAQQALRVFGKMSGQEPESTLQALDQGLRGTRGAAALVVDLNWSKRELRHASVGNIRAVVIASGQKDTGLLAHPGALGLATRRFTAFTHPWPDQALLIAHSDGLSSRWDLDAYPGLSLRDPTLIAGVLYRDFHARKDDVVVFVGRERGSAAKETG